MPKVNWDQSKVDDSRQPTSFDVMPRGKYPCVIVDNREVTTKSKDGSYFEFEFEVVKGDFSKRRLWARLNVNNPSEVAQNIGRAQFKQLCKAAGKDPDKVKDSNLLNGKYVVCLVSIERDGQFGDKNRVDGFISPAEFKEKGEEPPSKDDAPPPRAAAAGKGKAPVKGKAAAKGKPEEELEDDDIPF